MGLGLLKRGFRSGIVTGIVATDKTPAVAGRACGVMAVAIRTCLPIAAALAMFASAGRCNRFAARVGLPPSLLNVFVVLSISTRLSIARGTIVGENGTGAMTGRMTKGSIDWTPVGGIGGDGDAHFLPQDMVRMPDLLRRGILAGLRRGS